MADSKKKDKNTLEELLDKKQEMADWSGGTVKFPRPRPQPDPIKITQMDEEKQNMLKSILKRGRA